jgi:hypothetical protein
MVRHDERDDERHRAEEEKVAQNGGRVDAVIGAVPASS